MPHAKVWNHDGYLKDKLIALEAVLEGLQALFSGKRDVGNGKGRAEG